MSDRTLIYGLRFIDGDTVVDKHGRTYRIGGIDALETPHSDDDVVSPAGIVAKDIAAHTDQGIRFTDNTDLYGRGLAYLEPLADGKTSNEILIASGLAGVGDLEEPPADVRRARAMEFARTMRGIKDEEAEEIKAFVRKINTTASAHGIPGFNIRESQGYIAPNRNNVVRNSLARGVDTLQKSLYKAAAGASDFIGFDSGKEWADRNALLNDIDIRRNPARVASMDDIHGVKDALIYGLERVTEQAPNLAFDAATAAATGGLGYVAKGLGMATKVANWAKAGAAASSVLQNTGEAYDSMKQAGAEHAAGGAMLTGLAMGALDFAGLDYMAKGIMKPFGVSDEIAEEAMKHAVGAKMVAGDILKTIGKTSAFEGATEGLQEVTKDIGVHLAGGDTDKLGPLSDRFLESVVAGGLVGGVYGGAGRSVKHGIDAYSNHNKEKEARNADLNSGYGNFDDDNAQQIDASGAVVHGQYRGYNPLNDSIETEQGYRPEVTEPAPEPVQPAVEPVQPTVEPVQPTTESEPVQPEVNSEPEPVQPTVEPEVTPEPEPVQPTVDDKAATIAQLKQELGLKTLDPTPEAKPENNAEEELSQPKNDHFEGSNPRRIIEDVIKGSDNIPKAAREAILSRVMEKDSSDWFSMFNKSLSGKERTATIGNIIKKHPDIEQFIKDTVSNEEVRLKKARIEAIDQVARDGNVEKLRETLRKNESEREKLEAFKGYFEISQARSPLEIGRVRESLKKTVLERLKAKYPTTISEDEYKAMSPAEKQRNDEAYRKSSINQGLFNAAKKRFEQALKSGDADGINSVLNDHLGGMSGNGFLASRLLTDKSTDFNTFASTFADGNYSAEQIADKINSMALADRAHHKILNEERPVNDKTEQALERLKTAKEQEAFQEREHIVAPEKRTQPAEHDEAVEYAANRFMQGVESVRGAVNNEYVKANDKDNSDEHVDYAAEAADVNKTIYNDQSDGTVEAKKTIHNGQFDSTEVVKVLSSNDQFDITDINDLELLREAVKNGYGRDSRKAVNRGNLINNVLGVFGDQSFEAQQTYAQLTSEERRNEAIELLNNRIKDASTKPLDLETTERLNTFVDGVVIASHLKSISAEMLPTADAVRKIVEPTEVEYQALAGTFEVDVEAMRKGLKFAEDAVAHLVSTPRGQVNRESFIEASKTGLQMLGFTKGNAAKLALNAYEIRDRYRLGKQPQETLDNAYRLFSAGFTKSYSPAQVVDLFYEIGILDNGRRDDNAFVNRYSDDKLTGGEIASMTVSTTQGVKRTVNLSAMVSDKFEHSEFSANGVVLNSSLMTDYKFIGAVNDALASLSNYRADGYALDNVYGEFDKLPDNAPLLKLGSRTFTKGDYDTKLLRLIATQPTINNAQYRAYAERSLDKALNVLRGFESFTIDDNIRRLGIKARESENIDYVTSLIDEIKRLRDTRQQQIAKDGVSKADFDKVLEATFGNTDKSDLLDTLYRSARSLADGVDTRNANNNKMLDTDSYNEIRDLQSQAREDLNAVISTLRENITRRSTTIAGLDVPTMEKIKEQLETVRAALYEANAPMYRMYDEISQQRAMGKNVKSDRSEDQILLYNGSDDEEIGEPDGRSTETDHWSDAIEQRLKEIEFEQTIDFNRPRRQAVNARQVINEQLNSDNEFVVVQHDNGQLSVTEFTADEQHGYNEKPNELFTTDVKGINDFYEQYGDKLLLSTENISNYLANERFFPTVVNVAEMSRALGAGTFEVSPATTAREVLDAAISLARNEPVKTPRQTVRELGTRNRKTWNEVSFTDADGNFTDINDDLKKNNPKLYHTLLGVRGLIRRSGIANEVEVVFNRNDDTRVESFEVKGGIAYRIHIGEINENTDIGLFVMKLGHEVGHIVLDLYSSAFEQGALSAESNRLFDSVKPLYGDILANPTAEKKEAFADAYAQAFSKALFKRAIEGRGDKSSFARMVYERFKNIGKDITKLWDDILNVFGKVTGRKQVRNTKELDAFFSSMEKDIGQYREYARQMQENLSGKKILSYAKRAPRILNAIEHIAASIVPNIMRLNRINKDIGAMFTRQVHLKTVLQKRAVSKEIAGGLYKGNKINAKAVERGYADLVNGRTDTQQAKAVMEWLNKVNDLVRRTLDPNGIGAYEAHTIKDGKIPYNLDRIKVEKNAQAVVDILTREGIPDAKNLVDVVLRGTDDEMFGAVRQRWSDILADDKHRAALSGYLESNGVAVINSHIHNLTHTAAMRAAFGAHARNLDGTLMKGDDGKVLFKSRLKLNHYVAGLTEPEAKAVSDIYRSLNGDWGYRAPNFARNTFNTMNLLSSMSILTYAGIANVMDTAIPLMRAGKMGIAIKAIAQSVKQIVPGSRKEALNLAHNLGVINHAVLQNSLSGIFVGDRNLVGRSVDKLADFYFTATGMNFTTKISRVVATAVAYESFKHAAKDPTDRTNSTFLERMGISAKDVQTVSHFIGDNDVNIIFDDTIPMDADTAAAVERFKNGLTEFVSNSTLDPNSLTDPIIASNPWFALLMNLKRFFYAFHDTVIKGQWNETAKRFSQASGIKDVPYVAYPLFSTLLFMMPLSFAAWWLREFFRDGDVDTKNPADLPADVILKETFMRSGIMGLGEIYANADRATEYGTPAALSFTPSVAQFWRVGNDLYHEKWERAAKDGVPFYQVIQNWKRTYFNDTE